MRYQYIRFNRLNNKIYITYQKKKKSNKIYIIFSNTHKLNKLIKISHPNSH